VGALSVVWGAVAFGSSVCVWVCTTGAGTAGVGVVIWWGEESCMIGSITVSCVCRLANPGSREATVLHFSASTEKDQGNALND